MDINDIMIYVLLSVAIIGVVVAVVVGVLSYKRINKDIENGKIELFIQPKLANTDISIFEAVKNLKIVNASINVGENDDTTV